MYKTVDPALGLSMDKDYGEVDAKALLEEELASRGYDKDGHWIGCR